MKARALAETLAGHVAGDADADIVRAVHPAEASDERDIAIAISPDAVRLLDACPARAVLVLEGTELPRPFQTVIAIRRSRSNMPAITRVFRHHPPISPGIHPSAVVAPDARIGDGAMVGPLAVIGPGAAIGPGSAILSQATVEADAVIGSGCLIHPGVRIGWGCRIGDRVILAHNVSIGADGFSFVAARTAAHEAARQPGACQNGAQRNEQQKIHSLSVVEIGDDVDIGALTAIDRGTLKPTRIGAGTKIDDLVLIGHNVEIGTDCLLCGQVGLAGSVTIGNSVVLGGRVGVADHIRIGDRAVIAAAACVGTNVPAGAVYAGYPAVPHAEALENLRVMRRLRRLLARLTET
ncbi:UDP-3-O-(3-hydroxymyristoyl)glucosamine N-acyltransferase [Rhodopila sp.]|uniref:UDP-3-O-(3-hydroxymyristoyl)glucosamine N-acyltransferase n=1 Tax=Rhodopila sp. TaxID=2480087 RepID=UPI002B58359D|nr:UDP-3-O-(3-hydroxymyristoyl)glucosamine N-acyltransferase [Rhodopila sp.]HVZ10042.1 UDP-3-O-(3-hydroxymyristoyl)glucosamine N-acyltransferase [Rhodopila sp.]